MPADNKLSKPQSLPQVLADHLRQEIFYGNLLPGTRIDQDAIIDKFQVSRIPLREALLTLEGEGLVENIPRRGAFVVDMEPQDVIDHFMIYGVLAGRAAQRGAINCDHGTLTRLREILDRMELTDDPSELEHLNFRFHRTIDNASGSRRLNAVLRQLEASIPGGFYHAHPEWKAVGHEDHLRILEALENHDMAAAALATEEHLIHSGRFAVEMQRKRGWWPNTDGDSTSSESADSH